MQRAMDIKRRQNIFHSCNRGKGPSLILSGIFAVGAGIVSTGSEEKLPEALRLIMIDTRTAEDQHPLPDEQGNTSGAVNLLGIVFFCSSIDDDYIAQVPNEEKEIDEIGHAA